MPITLHTGWSSCPPASRSPTTVRYLDNALVDFSELRAILALEPAVTVAKSDAFLGPTLARFLGTGE